LARCGEWHESRAFADKKLPQHIAVFPYSPILKKTIDWLHEMVLDVNGHANMGKNGHEKIYQL
jgi:hypothetical protein